jgi:predicted metal-dependent enzyme (double-stranded beta helix superfamily)
MAPVIAPALGLPGVDQFSPAQLLRLARLFACDPALPGMPNPDSQESQWVQLDSRHKLQIWLLTWPPGMRSEWHDHGESAGAFQIVSGSLLEQTSSGRRREFRTLVAGEGRSFEQNHIHQLSNVRTCTALSVHVYAPCLTATMRCAITPTGLRSGVVDLTALEC